MGEGHFLEPFLFLFFKFCPIYCHPFLFLLGGGLGMCPLCSLVAVPLLSNLSTWMTVITCMSVPHTNHSLITTPENGPSPVTKWTDAFKPWKGTPIEAFLERCTYSSWSLYKTMFVLNNNKTFWVNCKISVMWFSHFATWKRNLNHALNLQYKISCMHNFLFFL